MRPAAVRRLQRSFVRTIAVRGFVVATTMMAATAADAQENHAAQILQAMSNYIAAQNSVSLTYDSDIEVVTPDLQKIQFTSSGQVQLSRPDKLRARRTGGYADVELVFDGKTFTLNDRDNKAFAQAEFSGTIDQLVNKLRNEYSVEAPGADLLLSSPYNVLMENVIDAKYIGLGVIDDVECEHLAFRTQDTDWQIWIEAGSRPIPRKLVITSKGVTHAPQYTLRVKELKTDALISANTFQFNPAAGATKVSFQELAGIDEIPPGNIVGEAR